MAKKELSDFEELGVFALTKILDGIKADLKEFHTFHDDFFFESSLFKDSKKSEFNKILRKNKGSLEALINEIQKI